MAQKSKKYDMVDDEEEVLEVSKPKKSKKSKKADKHSISSAPVLSKDFQKREYKHRRRESSGEEEEEDLGDVLGFDEEREMVAKVNKKSNNSKNTRAEPEIDPELELELEEEVARQDAEERDAFAKRILERDRENTKQIISSSEKAKRYTKNEPTPDEMFDMRIKSRRDYLRRREEDKMALLEQEIKDDRELFRGQTLTAKEKKDFKRKEQVLQYSKEYKKIIEKETDDRYHIPEANGMHAIPDKYLEVEEIGDIRDQEGNLIKQSDQARWESQHLKRSKFSNVGAKDQKAVSGVKEYDMIMEDSMIDFVQANTMAGSTGKTKKKKKKSKRKKEVVGEDGEIKMEMESSSEDEELPVKTEAMIKKEGDLSIQEVRESLPVRAYKEALLEAIEEHQVLIVTAETGSGKTTQIPQCDSRTFISPNLKT